MNLICVFFRKSNLDKTAVEDYRQYHRFDAKSDEAFRKSMDLFKRELEGYQRKKKNKAFFSSLVEDCLCSTDIAIFL